MPSTTHHRRMEDGGQPDVTPPQIWFPGHSPRPFYADFAIPLGGAPLRFLSTLPQPSSFDLALMDDLDIVAVRIEHPCRIIAGIVFEPSLRCCLAYCLRRPQRLCRMHLPHHGLSPQIQH